MKFYECQFADEAPMIGAGRRFVFAEVGHVWASLLTPQLESTKIRRAKWDGVRKVEIDLAADPERCRHLRRIMNRNERWRRRTNRVKRAEALLKGGAE